MMLPMRPFNIHLSVLRQKQILPQLKANIDKNPTLITGILPFKEDIKKHWLYIPGKHPPRDIKTKEKPDNAMHKSFFGIVIQKGTYLGQDALHEITHTEVIKNASRVQCMRRFS